MFLMPASMWALEDIATLDIILTATYIKNLVQLYT